MKRTLSILMSVIMTFTFFCSSITVEATENETENSAVENDISINGKNSFGQLMSEILAEEQDRQENNNGFNVFSAEVTGNTVTAEYEVLESCTMITAIYDEDGVQMITSGKTEVTPEENYTEVTIETDDIPQYFYLRIFLVDSQTLSPLCTAYESPNYTREMQDFFSKTTGDFEEERVLNLDDDNSNNFAVFNEDIIISQSDDNLNTVVSADDENGIYVLENIDETVSGLENGDIFSCQYGEENILIAKVGEIEIDGTTAVITSEDTSLDAVFDYVKIDSSSGLSDADIDYDSMDEGIEYIGTENNNSRMISGTEGENTLTGDTLTLEIASKKIGKLELSGSLSLSSEVSVKTYISFTYQYFELKVENKLGFEISLSGSATSPAIVKLPPIDFSPVPGLYVGIQPALQIKFSGDISFTGGIKSSIGFNYDSDRGFKNISSKPEPDDMTISAEAKLFLGLIIEPRIVILHEKIAKAGFKCTSGVELTAKLKKKIGDYDSTHECNLCIDGDTSAKTELSCELTFFGLDNLTWEHKFADWSLKLNEFYYSIDKKEFGWGSCPYDKHKIKVKVIVGGNDHPCENAHVSYGKESCITASDGIADFLISDGYHTITVSCDNCETVQQKIYVNGDDKDITVHLWAIDPAKTTTATTLKPSGTNQTVTTTATTVPAEQPDENGKYIHDSVIYKCYDDYAVVSGYTDDVPNEVVILKEVCGLPVTEIGYSAFYDCEKLTSVKIPDSVTSIGDFAFSGCKNITSITIPYGITSIQHCTFQWCENLTSITIPDSVTIIGEMAFNNCDRLTSITIPNSVITIGEASFINCESFTSITIPESVTNIGKEAFWSCDNLTSVTIPDSVTIIGNQAFDWCDKLTDVYYTGTESQWNAIDIGYNYDEPAFSGVTIHFNSTAPAPTPAPPVMTPYNESFPDLKPDTLYNFYAFKDKNAVDKLSAENLLYIAQFTTDENGNADISYIPENDQILITEATYSIATADISIGDVVYTGSEVVPDIVVTWNGNQLTEGVDYETEGDLSAVNIGSYRILIKGTGEFSGYADVIYNVICSHNFADGICTICGDKKSETDVLKIILGDVNEDGMVNAIDATAVLEEYANLSTDRNGTFSDYQKLSGDINSDNMIDAVDASFILEFYAYLSTDGIESDMRVWLDIK